MFRMLALLATIGSAAAGTILWDGRFNDLSSSSDLNNWSWRNEVGPYQYYIHGSENITSYINLSPLYKNPSDLSSAQGAKITLDSTSYWNGQTMRRTELIPQTTAAINAGLVYYHFSMKRAATNAPSIYREHQICFFESHFTELKAGWISGEAGSSDALLRWDVSGTTHWNTTWEPEVWHNVAYAIDFSAGTVAFYHSTGADPLVLTVAAIQASASSNGEDWHLGVLELPVSGQTDTTEDFYFSGVYVESGDLTTSVAGPGGAVVVSSAASATTGTPTKTRTGTGVGATSLTTLVSGVSSATGLLAAKYAQCGGSGFGGATACVAGATCTVVDAYYSQCL